MANPIAACHAEHAYFKQLLRLLHKQVDVFHTGKRPNYELMLDIISSLKDLSGMMKLVRVVCAGHPCAEWRLPFPT